MVSTLVRSLLLPLVMGLLLCMPARAEADLSARQWGIWEAAFKIGGYLSKEMHAEFWSTMPEAGFKNDQDRDAYIKRLERATLGYLTFEQEVWNSRKASQEAGQFVQTPAYETAKAEALAALDEISTQNDWKADIKSEDETIKPGAELSLALDPANPFHITASMMDQTLADIEKSQARIRKLANPVWAGKPVDQVFPDLHVKILWDGEFTKGAPYQTDLDGKKVDAVAIFYRMSIDKIIVLRFLKLSTGPVEPSEDASRTVSLSMETYGIVLPTFHAVESEWRGRMTASGQGATKVKSMAAGEETGEMLTVSSRAVVLEEENAILLISVATQGTKDPTAGQIRERLEEKLQILR